jgi:hypothetical protein
MTSFQSISRVVPVSEMDRPDVAVVVIEALCWHFAMADSNRRRPRFWRRREHDKWCVEHEALTGKTRTNQEYGQCD